MEANKKENKGTLEGLLSEAIKEDCGEPFDKPYRINPDNDATMQNDHLEVRSAKKENENKIIATVYGIDERGNSWLEWEQGFHIFKDELQDGEWALLENLVKKTEVDDIEEGDILYLYP